MKLKQIVILIIFSLAINQCPDELVERGVHLTIPWRWIRSIGDVVLLRWFPKTPIPYDH